MAKPLINNFPKLRAKMAYYSMDTTELSKILQISEDSVRRRLRNEVEFTLPEIVILMKYFKCTFEELFGSDAA